MRQILQSVISHLKSTTNHYMDEVMRTEKFALVGTMASSTLHDFHHTAAQVAGRSVGAYGVMFTASRYLARPF